MIILDAEEQRKQWSDPYTGGLTLRYPEKAAARFDTALPDYETSEAATRLEQQESLARQRVRERWKLPLAPGVEPRLWKAVVIALGIYVLLSLVIGLPIVMVKRKQAKNDGSDGPPPPWDDGNDPGGVNVNLANVEPWVFDDLTACDISLIDDKGMDLDPPSSKVTHVFDTTGTLYMHSNITALNTNTSTGQLTVTINPNPSVTDTIIRVAVNASSKPLLQDTKVCMVDSGVQAGIFFYVSRKMKKPDSLTIDVQVLLAQSGIRELRNLVVYLPWFHQNIGDLTSLGRLQTIILEGAGYDIHAEALDADTISINNAWASITGNFIAEEKLSLQGIKSNITANVTLDHKPKNVDSTYLTVATGDGFINSQVTLVAPITSKMGFSSPAFLLDISTFNAPLNLTVVHAPSTLPVPIQLNVKNNNGKTYVGVDNRYQGTFLVQNQLSTVGVREANVPPSKDPLGKGRSRTVDYEFSRIPTFARGWVGWGSPSETLVDGQLSVSSTLSPLILQLGLSAS